MSTQAILKGLSWLTVWLAISLSATEAVAVPNANGSLRFTLVPMRHESTKAKDGSDVIKMKGFGRELSPGNPVLPRKVYNIAIPPNVIWSSIKLKVISANTHALEGTYDLQPAGPCMASAGGRIKESWGASKRIINGKNADIYEVNANYPHDPVKLLPQGQMRKWKFVRLSFSPFQYNPIAKKLFLTEKIEIELSYSLSDEKMAQSLISDTVMDDVAAQTLLNYDQAKTWYTPAVPASGLAELQSGEMYPYVIITTNAIVSGSNNLADFIAHKRRSQDVLVVTEDDFDGLMGPPPNCRAEKIRQWLINNYASMHIKYVLLIGNPTPFESGGNDIPMKMCWPRRGEDEDKESPTDYFYADLTGNWDKDGDEYYGEYTSDYDVSGGVDLTPEVYVGRIPVYDNNSYTDMDNILQKIIDYETEPIEDNNWRQSILLPMSFLLSKFWGLFIVDGADLGEQMKDDYLDDAGYSSWRMYQQGHGKCGDDSDNDSEEELRGSAAVINRWRNNDFGVVCWSAHGNATEAVVGYGDCEDGVLMSYSYTSVLDDDHPSFTYQCSCSNGYPENENNLQYAILKQGGIATVGASRVSWFHPFQGYGEFDDGDKTDAGIGYEYVQRLVSADAWYSAAGVALYSAKSWNDQPDCGEWLMNVYGFNLYGDPTTSLSSHARLTVKTWWPWGVEGSSVTLSGQLTDMGTASSVQVSFLWGNSPSLTNETPPQTLTAPGYFYASLTGLTPETTYYYCAKAVGGGKTVYGDTWYVITSSLPPQVATNWVTDIATSAVTLNGNLASLGSASSVQVFFEWGDSTLYGNQTPPVTVTTAGPFSARISGLVAGTTYHFRAKAVGQGTGVGADRPFMFGAILRVPSDYHTIQTAINVANQGQIILVADGTYSGTGNQDLSLLGKRITLQSENGPANCIIDCQYSGRGFYFASGENPDTVVSGFTIKNGFAFSSYGGGIYCSYSSTPSIINCNITNCSAAYGGGIYGATALFINDCTINGNTASTSGGGIYCNGALTITGSTISNNTTPGYGGGITCRDASTITVCTISGNQANGTNAIAGGVYCYESMTIRNCTISGNRVYLNSPGLTGQGGGIYCRYNTIIADSLISGNEATGIEGGSGGGISCWDSTIIQNSIITGNKATGSYSNGGGIFAGGTPILTNCTITGNQATGTLASAGGGINCYGSPILTNCILWGDSPNEIQNGSPVVTYCDIAGGHAGIGNINAFPMLTNYHLECGSPCIDAGDNTAVPGGVVTDLDGRPRFKDDPQTGDTGNGIPPIVDMGAYEYQYVIYVNANATGANNGSSWANAYKYLQDAWTAAALYGDSIWVAQGTYRPDKDTAHPGGTNDRTATFQLKNNVAIYGGFPSGGGQWASRNPNTYKTIFSGDIGVAGNNSDNSYHVVTGSGTDSNSILDGFTITAGNANGSNPFNLGGGMYNYAGSPTLTNCIFSGNSAGSSGGGMENSNSSPTVTNCTFSGNSATSQGGGIYDYNSIPMVTNCAFSGNSAGSRGGGMYNSTGSSPTLTNCILWGNTAPNGGPQIYNYASSVTVSFSDVQGGYPGGNIDVNPLFVDADGPDNIFGTADDNLRLCPGSPCIDAGDNTAVPDEIETDLDGRPRFFNDPATEDSGNGTPPIVDMGAYEYQLIIFVDANATGNNNGSSWADAYKYLKDALTAAEPNYNIWVAQGTYRPDENSVYPDGNNSRTATFQLKNGVALYGGFPSGGGSRDPNTYETILSGDINVPDVNTDNSYHVVTGSNTNSTAILNGFTITKGKANGSNPYNYGGGMYNNGGSPTVTNCTFISNSASQNGGGMYNNGNSPTVTNCTFTGNSAYLGGGMGNYNNSHPTVTNCTFSGNSAQFGGGMSNDYYSSPTVTNCTFSGNSADRGGGIYNLSNSSPTVTNCTFTGNSAVGYGGGMFNFESSSPTITNCILWGNTAPTGPQIFNTATVSFSDVQGGWAGTGNINANPLFVDANGPDNIFGTEDDNLRLSDGSPCIDKGNNAGVPADIADLDGDANTTEPTPLDLDLRPRFVDGDFNGSIVVDMGAYEFACPYTSDFDGDCDVDFSDFAILTNSWLQNDPLRDIAPPPAGNGIVDLDDLAVLCDNWLAGK